MVEEIEFINFKEERKTVLVVEMIKQDNNTYKFKSKRLKLNPIEQKLLKKFIEDKLI